MQRIQKHMASDKKGLSNWGGNINPVLTLPYMRVGSSFHPALIEPLDPTISVEKLDPRSGKCVPVFLLVAKNPHHFC